MIDRYVSSQELRRLLSALLAVVGFLSLAAVFAFLVVPGLRYQAYTGHALPILPVRGETGWLDPTDYPPSARRTIPPLDPRSVMEPSPELMERGRDLYARNCASCHGSEGKGDGAGGAGLQPPPRNFTSPSGWKNSSSLEGVYRTLQEGIKGSQMLSYEHLGRRDRMALVHVVRGFGRFEHGPGNPAGRTLLEKSFSGSGETIPNRIPVRTAMALLGREAPPAPPLGRWRGDPVLREAIRDPHKAARTLAHLAGWERDPLALARALAIQGDASGFQAGVGTWPPERWARLQAALKAKGGKP
jgi:mono/diheme cytochrome c family protein